MEVRMGMCSKYVRIMWKENGRETHGLLEARSDLLG